MEDLDYNYQNQPNLTLGVADRTVAQLTGAENKADRERDNRLHTMNCREWTDEEKKRVVEDSINSEAQERDTQSKNVEWTTEMKVRLVQIDDEERKRGKRFMKRVKERWVDQYPEHATASIQKLRDNAARF